jgi:hypothetical protein
MRTLSALLCNLSFHLCTYDTVQSFPVEPIIMASQILGFTEWLCPIIGMWGPAQGWHEEKVLWTRWTCWVGTSRAHGWHGRHASAFTHLSSWRLLLPSQLVCCADFHWNRVLGTDVSCIASSQLPEFSILVFQVGGVICFISCPLVPLLPHLQRSYLVGLMEDTI